MRIHVLDANALYRFLTNGAGADIVANVFKEAASTGTPVMMSVINWGEVFYVIARTFGVAKTEKLLDQAREDLGLSVIIVNRENAIRAAKIKTQFGVPYADAFAAELTGGQHVLMTADLDHFQALPKIRRLKLPSHKKQ